MAVPGAEGDRPQVRERAFDGHTPVSPIRRAVASGHGIGKSALTAWIVLWLMSTRPDSRGTVRRSGNTRQYRHAGGNARSRVHRPGRIVGLRVEQRVPRRALELIGV